MSQRMFSASADFFREFTRVNDFAQVSAASVWTMRWQVKGFFAEAGFYEDERKRPKQSDLKSRFLAGSGLKRANFRSLVDGQTWPEQASILAEMTLLASLSLFEGWVEALGEEAGLAKDSREALQWPSHSRIQRFTNTGSPKLGIDDGIRAGRSNVSAVMQDCFYPAYVNDRFYSAAALDDLLICYRYWKEIRNAIAHAGGRVTSRLIAEEARLSSLTPAALNMSHVPRLSSLSLNGRVPTELNSVCNFGEVLHRIVVTVDAELSVSKKAETIMLTRWEDMRRNYYSDPPFEKSRRSARIRDWMLRAGLPEPHAKSTLDTFLTDRYGLFLRVP